MVAVVDRTSPATSISSIACCCCASAPTPRLESALEDVDDDLHELLDLVGVTSGSRHPERYSMCGLIEHQLDGATDRAQPVVRPLHRLGQHLAGCVAVRTGGNVTWNVTVMSVRRLPSSSRIFSAPTSTLNDDDWARREVRMSTSIAVHPPIAASSSSVGVKSASSPVPNDTLPPRWLTAAKRPGPMRSTVTCRCVGHRRSLPRLPGGVSPVEPL